ncbi:MAG: nucleoside hydrolase, partial [Leadbetterella sp.]
LISQKLNDEILQAAGMNHISHPTGGDRQMGRAWGEYTPRRSEATDAILQTIQKLGLNEKLDVLCLGAGTNIASALALQPSIVNKIRLFSMGFGYDFSKWVWNKNEFNIRADLNAADYLLNLENLDWHIIPVSTCLPYVYDRDSIVVRFQDHNPLEKIMKYRWLETNPDNKKRVLWDMALVQAYLNPSLVEEKTIATPPENTSRTIKMYSKISYDLFYQDFWREVEKNRENFTLPSNKPQLGDLHFSNRTGGTIGQEGKTKQLILCEKGDVLTSIEIGLNPDKSIVSALKCKVTKKDGSLTELIFGIEKNTLWQKPIVLSNKKYLVGISGASGWFVDNIQLHFSDGTKSPLYGGNGGDNDYSLQLSKNTSGKYKSRFVGFWGSYTDKLESLGLIYFPAE